MIRTIELRESGIAYPRELLWLTFNFTPGTPPPYAVPGTVRYTKHGKYGARGIVWCVRKSD